MQTLSVRVPLFFFQPKHVKKHSLFFTQSFSLNVSICCYLFLNMTSDRALSQLDSSELYREEWRQLAEMNKVII